MNTTSPWRLVSSGKGKVSKMQKPLKPLTKEKADLQAEYRAAVLALEDGIDAANPRLPSVHNGPVNRDKSHPLGSSVADWGSIQKAAETTLGQAASKAFLLRLRHVTPRQLKGRLLPASKRLAKIRKRVDKNRTALSSKKRSLRRAALRRIRIKIWEAGQIGLSTF